MNKELPAKAVAAVVNRKHLLVLALIILISAEFRATTVSNSYVQTMADPWYFVRITQEIVDNGYVPPQWDSLSHSPPGRVFYPWLGWNYFIIMLKLVAGSSVMYAANIAPIGMAVIAGIFAYLLGKKLSGEKWGGVIATILVMSAPVFISTSYGGYADTDSVVMALSLVSVYSLFIAHERRDWKGYLFAILAGVWFITSWNTGYYPLFLFSGLMVLYILKDLSKHDRPAVKKNVLFIMALAIPTLLLSYLAGVNIIARALEMQRWFGGEMVVTLSVAELHTTDIWTTLVTASQQVGVVPMVAAFAGLPIYLFFSFRRKKLDYKDLFMLIWFAFMAVLLSAGLRFALLFSVPTLLLASFFITKGMTTIRDRNKEVLMALTCGLLCLFLVFTLSLSALFVQDSPIPADWQNAMGWLQKNADKNALLVTWWDPGHYMAAMTGLRVHADGAHCPPQECIPWNHNDRIQDAGRILATEKESEAIELLEKYKQLSPEDEQKSKALFPQAYPTAYTPASEIYLILSGDLLGKFVWLDYYGSYAHDIETLEVAVGGSIGFPGQCEVPDKPDIWVYCPWVFAGKSKGDYIEYANGPFVFMVKQKGSDLVPFFAIQQNGTLFDSYMVENLVAMQNGKAVRFNYTNYETDLKKLPGTLWVSEGFTQAVYLHPKIDNSIVFRGYLFNEPLAGFEKVFNSNEVKVFKLLESNKTQGGTP